MTGKSFPIDGVTRAKELIKLIHSDVVEKNQPYFTNRLILFHDYYR